MQRIIRITLSPRQEERATKVGILRHRETYRLECYRALFDPHGDAERVDIIAACSELAAACALRVYWPGDVNSFKSKPDIPPDIEVRNTIYQTGHLLIRNNDPKDRRYILTIGSPPAFDVVGWIPSLKDYLREEWIQAPNGEPPAYFIPQAVLEHLSFLIRDLRRMI